MDHAEVQVANDRFVDSVFLLRWGAPSYRQPMLRGLYEIFDSLLR
jgi:hypothetical protein